MALWGMVIDLDRCTGCQACVMACEAENNVPGVGAKEASRGRTISWMHVLVEESEERTRFLPRPCLQCDDPRCTRVCPGYARSRKPEGLVAQLYARGRACGRGGGRELAPGDYVPASAETCPTRAIAFGDLSDSGSEVARLAKSPRAFRLNAELGTKPKVIYLSETEAHGRV